MEVVAAVLNLDSGGGEGCPRERFLSKGAFFVLVLVSVVVVLLVYDESFLIYFSSFC